MAVPDHCLNWAGLGIGLRRARIARVQIVSLSAATWMHLLEKIISAGEQQTGHAALYDFRVYSQPEKKRLCGDCSIGDRIARDRRRTLGDEANVWVDYEHTSRQLGSSVLIGAVGASTDAESPGSG